MNNCPRCRAGEHDACFFIVEVDRDKNPVMCACFENDHQEDRPSNFKESS